MFGIEYIKFDSMSYCLLYKNGRIVKEGQALSFFYFSPNSSIVSIPMGSNDLPFIFEESTNDYQKITIQGQIIYKVVNPKLLASLLDFTIDKKGIYKKNDGEKLNQRIINTAQTSTSAYIRSLGLKDAIRSAKNVEKSIVEGLRASEQITMLGIDIVDVNILAIKANPEMQRALETETRERLQQEADQAIYERRNFAVEQERRIKESELNTQIAIEEKKIQIDQKVMEASVLKVTNERKLREMNIEADISVESQRKELIGIQIENDKKKADSKEYALRAGLSPYKEMDWKTLMAISSKGDPKLNVAVAFRELAQNADKIQNLNISPDLLSNLIS